MKLHPNLEGQHREAIDSKPCFFFFGFVCGVSSCRAWAQEKKLQEGGEFFFCLVAEGCAGAAIFFCSFFSFPGRLQVQSKSLLRPTSHRRVVSISFFFAFLVFFG